MFLYFATIFLQQFLLSPVLFLLLLLYTKLYIKLSLADNDSCVPCCTEHLTGRLFCKVLTAYCPLPGVWPKSYVRLLVLTARLIWTV